MSTPSPLAIAQNLSHPSPSSLQSAIDRACQQVMKLQHTDGYWWFTLEANETIGAGFIQLMHFIREVDMETQNGLAQRILSQQGHDGSWTLFFEGPGDISTTVECYFALRLAGLTPDSEPLKRAKEFILSQGGLSQVRIFTRIHLALFGLIPWSACPSMPIWLMLLPHWSKFSIYEFSSWARACIVPLLLIGDRKPVHPLSFDLDELFTEPKHERVFRFPKAEKFFSLQNFFIRSDKVLKMLEKSPWHPGKKKAVDKAIQWVREHIERTEDIYPAMAYAVLAFKTLGLPNSDPTIQKALKGLKGFQEKGEHTGSPLQIHQQCCISPNWDTPWVGVALLEADIEPHHPQILKSVQYLLKKQIVSFKGDWKIKNPHGTAGGWSFEFENDFFPDVDDTIEAILFLKNVGVQNFEPLQKSAILRGLDWLLSMQSSNGGWAAFDKNNTMNWVNQIPFSDHGACLDPPTTDITGRMIELLSSLGYTENNRVIQRAVRFLKKNQDPTGAWPGRWGVSFIYGTWCVLQGLATLDHPLEEEAQKAVQWLMSVQNKDGGWGESPLSDSKRKFVPVEKSVPSQTAWAVMGLIAGRERNSLSVRRGIEWLLKNQHANGTWTENEYTGTGFPGHFYIRYHGYRYYFPLLALAKYLKN